MQLVQIMLGDMSVKVV